MDIQELLSRVGQNLSVSRSFGAAYEKDGAMIIPVAFVAGGGGGGEGTGPASSASSDESAHDHGASASSEELAGGGARGLDPPRQRRVTRARTTTVRQLRPKSWRVDRAGDSGAS